jgi:disease resistance protein RPS2
MAEAISAGSFLEPLCGWLESTGMLEAATWEVVVFLRVKANWGDLEKAQESLRAVETAVRAGVAEEEDKLNVYDPQVQLWLRRVDVLHLDNTIDEDYASTLKFSCLCQCTVHAVVAPGSASVLWRHWRR